MQEESTEIASLSKASYLFKARKIFQIFLFSFAIKSVAANVFELSCMPCILRDFHAIQTFLFKLGIRFA